MQDMKFDQGKVMPLEDPNAPSDVQHVAAMYRLQRWWALSVHLSVSLPEASSVADLVLSTGAVLHYGAGKYSWGSWRTVPNALYRYLNAWARHDYPDRYYPESPVNDPETRFPHEWHAWCNIVFCLKLLEEK